MRRAAAPPGPSLFDAPEARREALARAAPPPPYVPPPEPPPPAPPRGDGVEDGSVLSSILGALRQLAARDPEVIDGTAVEDAAREVMLEVAHSPVLPARHDDDAPEVDVPWEALPTEGGGYLLRAPDGRVEGPVDADALRRMRARYLLQRAAYWRGLRTMGYQQQQRVLGLYFPRGVWSPQPGTELAEKMGVRG